MKHLIALFLLAPLAFAADLSGIWFHSAKASDGHTVKMALVLAQTGTQLSGKVKLPWGDVAITQGSVDGNHFALTVKESTWFNLTADGSLEADKLHFTVHENNDKPYDVLAERVTTDPFVIANIATPPPVKDLAPNGLAKTPPMGWNSWNLFAGRIDDKTVREMADALVTSGMRDAGYIYLNIDDTWEGDRDASGVIHAYAAWGVDYLKYDWCSAGRLYKDDAMQAVYQKMAEALRSTKRPIVYSLCQYGRNDVWTWGAKAGGNLWRSTGDISDNWKSMIGIADRQSAIAQYAGPGHWNDPDMLEIGNGGMTTDEYRTHMSLWAMFAAPLLAGNDVRTMSADTKSILLNKEVIAVNQDPMGAEGLLVGKIGEADLFARPLNNGDSALVVVNRADAASAIKLPWSEMHVAVGSNVRDLWKHEDFKAAADQSFTIPPHGSLMFRMKASK